MVRNFIFDLDGTLVDSLPGIGSALNAALPPGSQHAGDMRDRIGPPVRSILRTLAGPCAEARTEDGLDRMEARFREAYDNTAWRETVVFTGVREVLEELRAAGKRLFVATNKPLKPTLNILGMLDLLNLFEDVITPDSATPPFRNKSEMLRSLMDLWQLDAEECVFVGDTMDDYRAAESAGMRSVFLAHGYGAERILREAPGQPVFADAASISQTFLKQTVIHNGGAL